MEDRQDHDDDAAAADGSGRAGAEGDAAVVMLVVLRLDSGLPLPGHARPDDAGLDLTARTGGLLAPAGGRCLVPTGMAIALPTGYAAFVLPRSGLALHHGVTCLNAPGLIDPGYRGEVKVLLVNTDPREEFGVRPR